MAKEVHGYIKTLLVIGAIVFAGGGYAMKVNDNTHRIAKTEEVEAGLIESVHALELADRDVANIAGKSLEQIILMNGKLEAIQQTQMQQSTILAVNSEKLKSLAENE